MSTRRALRVAEAVREVVATAILFELRDPRIQGVTVTRTAVSDDLQVGKVYISVMAGPTGDGNREKAEQLAMHGLRSATGFLQSKVADRLQIRRTPRLSFYIDEGVKNQQEISRILREVLPREPVVEPDEDADEMEDGMEESSESESVEGMENDQGKKVGGNGECGGIPPDGSAASPPLC